VSSDRATRPRAGGAKRLASFEVERRRAFEDAQREADTMFAQYQLSQLLASGDVLEDLASAVLAEIARASGAALAGLWLAEPNESPLVLVAAVGPVDGADDAVDPFPPARFDGLATARAWAVAGAWSGIALEESRDLGARGVERTPIGFVAVRPGAGMELDPGHVRYLSLVRRELGVTFRAAQLRSTLARERATLAATLEGAIDAIVAVDVDRRVVRFNAAAANLVGVSARDSAGATCREFLGCDGGRSAASGEPGEPGDPGDPGEPGDGRRPAGLLCGPRCPFEEVLETGLPIAARAQRVRSRGRVEIPMAGSYSRISDPRVGAVAVLRDLRPTLVLEELRSSFVAAVSHELRTPLALIDGYAQSLLHLDLDETVRRGYLERLGAAVERVAGLVDQIVDIAQLDSDGLTLEPEPIAVEQLLGEFATEQAELPGAPTVELDLGPDLPDVDVDAPRIHQVLANLGGNTAKYAGPDARLTIRARRGGRRTVVITVADDGPGIDAEQRSHVFERFYRGRSVRESRIPGNGLGLYLAKRIVEAHGGWIRLDSAPRGTSISFALPAADDVDASSEMVPQARQGREPE
jgi:signal transduction histidine kinase